MNTTLSMKLAPEVTKDDFLLLRQKANWVRRTVLDMALGAQSGHITTAFSATELFLSLYHGILRYDSKNLSWEDRDRFVLSEGQAGIGLYPVLADAGFFPKSELQNFVKEGSTLGVHAEPRTPGIQVLTGSLGHGLPIATGMADVGKQEKKDWLVVCQTGDGELSEGSNWEAMITADTLQLGNLIVLVNRNHQFTLGFTDRRETQRDIVLDPLDKKFAAFGFEVKTINGHSFPEIFEAFKSARERAKTATKPLVIIADTVKGNGGFFANQRMWHYRVPSGADVETLRRGLEAEARSLGIK
ncbi:MAG TPA: transketolase [Candidatus Paceibacterota bacterium]|nr:transketolase [Candidatus Paceibacterota bacterium]